MVDVVANHFGPGGVGTNGPSPLHLASSYHDVCDIDYGNETSIRMCRLARDLPDVNTTDPIIRDTYNTWIGDLVKNYSIDGLRLDGAKHVENDFWPDFITAAGVYAIGEVANSGDSAYVAPFQKVMPGLLNFPMYRPLCDFFLQRGISEDIVDMHNRISADFLDPTALGTFIDNHDGARWLSQNNDTALLKNALAFTILARGIPVVYYGTEQGFTGPADQNNREDLWRSNFDTSSDLYQAISRLSAARVKAGGLGGDDHQQLDNGDNYYTWHRVNGDLVVYTTNGGSTFRGQQCFNSKVANGSWDDIYNSGSYTSDSNGQVCVNVINGDPVVLWTNANEG